MVTETLRPHPLPRALGALLLVCGLAAGQQPGDLSVRTPQVQEDVGVVERLEAEIDRDLPFTDHRGRRVSFGEFFGGKPVLLTMNYSSCPRLCSLQLDSLVETIEKSDSELGVDYGIVTVIIDPEEGVELTARRRSDYLAKLGLGVEAEGWDFLVGAKPQIQALADRVGYRYRYLPDLGEYAHAWVAMVISPQGRVSSYLYHEIAPEQLERALEDARQEKATPSMMEQVGLILCYRYDPESGSFVPSAFKIMRLGGVLIVLSVLGFVLYWRRRESRPAPQGRPLLQETL
jgi:protein SCO1/2